MQEDSEVFSGVTCSPKLLKSELDYLSLGHLLDQGKEKTTMLRCYNVDMQKGEKKIIFNNIYQNSCIL